MAALPDTAAVRAPENASLDETSILAANNKLLPEGESFHVVTLSSGERVPTGTVAAFMKNLKAYEECAEAESSGKLSPEEVQDKKKSIESEIRQSLPLLKKLGMFELFSVEEWGSNTARASRKFVAEEARRNGW